MAIIPESIWTADDLSYTVLVYNCNTTEQMVSSILKYSKRKYSPLLCDNIRFSTPGRFRTIEVPPGSELTRDELEATRQEFIPIEKTSELHNQIAREINAEPLKLMTRLKITSQVNDCWIYSTAADYIPKEKQSSDHNCITRMDNPYKFALQIGRNIAQTICSNKEFVEEHLEYCPHGKDFDLYNQLHESNSWIGEKVILVIHGLVEYTYDEPGENNLPIQFIKRRTYSVQHEYRFSVQVLGYSMKELYTDIETPADLKSLMSLVDNDLQESLVIKNVSPQNMVERLFGERIETVQLQCRDGDDWVKVCDYDLNTHQPKNIDTTVSNKYLNFDLLNVDVSQMLSSGELNVSLKVGALVRGDVLDTFSLAVKVAGYPPHIKPINLIKDSA